MDISEGSMHFASTLDSSQWQAGVQDMQKSFVNLAQDVEKEGGNIDAVISKIGQAAAAIGVGFSAVSFVKQVASVRGEFQALEQSFKTLLGSEEQANDLMQQLTKTAAVTPFDLQGVARGAKQLLAYGVEADKVNDKLVQLGDIAAGMGLSIDYITQLYGTTISKAHMDTMDLKQFMGQGIAIDQAIAEVMRVTKEEVPKLVTAGQVTSDIVEKAINQLASGDGKFAGMMANQSKTILGQISNIEDAVTNMFNNIGKSNEGIISDVLSGVSFVVENYEKVGRLIAEVVAAYGLYKGVLIAITAYQKAAAVATAAQTGAQTAAKAATLLLKDAQIALGKAMQKTNLAALANPYVLMAAAVAAAAYGVYKLVTYETEEEKAVKRVNEAHKAASANVMKETAKLRSLCDALKATTPETEAYAKAKENLLNFADKYDPKLRSELELINDTQKMYELAAQAVHKYYMTKARDSALESAEEDYAKTKVESQTKIYEQFEKVKKSIIDDAAEEGLDASQAINDIDKYFAEVQKAIEEGNLRVKTNAGIRNYTITGISAEAAKFLQDKAKEKVIFDDIASTIRDESTKIYEAANVREAAIKRANAIFGEGSTTSKATPEFERLKQDFEAKEQAFALMLADTSKQSEDALQKASKDYEDALEAYRKAGGKAEHLVFQKRVEEARKEVEDSQKALNAVLASANSSVTAVNSARERLKNAEENYEKLTGEKKEAKQNKKIEDALKKKAEERAKLEARLLELQQSTEYSTESSLAAEEENATKKEIASITKRYQDQAKAIEKAKKEVTEALTKGYVTKSEADEQNKQYDNMLTTLETNRDRDIRNYFTKEIRSAASLGLKEHEKYEQQKTEITENAIKERARLQTIIESDTATEEQKKAAQNAQKRSFTQQSADLAKVDLTEFQNSDYYKNVFGDLQNYGETTINAMMDKMQEFGSQIKESMNPSDIKAFEDAMQQLQMRMIEIDPFAALKTSSDELKKALKEQKSAMDKVTQAQTFAKIAQTNYDIAVEEYGADSEEAADAQQELSNATSELAKANEDYAKSENNVAKAANKAQKARDLAKNAVQNLTDGLQSVANQIGGTFEQVTQVITGVVNLVQVSVTAMDTVAKEGVAAMKAVETASVILAIISAVLTVLQSIDKLLNGTDEEFEQFIKNADAARKAIRDMKREMALDESINNTIFDENRWEDLLNNVDVAREKFQAFIGIFTNYDKMREALQAKYEAKVFSSMDLPIADADRAAAAQAKYEALSSELEADFAKIREQWGGTFSIEDLNEYFQEAGKKIAQFEVKTREASNGFLGIGGHHSEWTALKDLGLDLWDENGAIDMDALVTFKGTETFNKLSQEGKTYIENLTVQWEDYQKALEQMTEGLKSIFSDLGNTLGDALVDAFQNGTDAAEEFESTFYNMMMEMAKSQVISQYFSQIFEDMTNDMNSVLTSGKSDEEMREGLVKVASEGAAEIKDKIPAATEAIEAWSNALNEAGLTAKTTADQQASYGGYETMSEQTGTELSGRFSAMYIVQSQQLELETQMYAAIKEIPSVLTSQNATLSDIRSLQAIANDYLSTIASCNRAMIAQWSASIENIEKYTKSLI